MPWDKLAGRMHSFIENRGRDVRIFTDEYGGINEDTGRDEWIDDTQGVQTKAITDPSKGGIELMRGSDGGAGVSLRSDQTFLVKDSTAVYDGHESDQTRASEVLDELDDKRYRVIQKFNENNGVIQLETELIS